MTKWRSEDEHTEYKRASGSIPTAVWETYSAFLNTDGGTIYLGVEEATKGHFETIGVGNAEKLLSDFVTGARNKKNVSYVETSNIEVNVAQFDEKEVIVIQVPKADPQDKPIYIKNNTSEVYYRIGDSDQRLSQREINYMLVDSVESQDNRVVPFFDFDDMDHAAFIAFRETVENSEKTERLKELSDIEFALEMGIMDFDRDKDGKRPALTVAGLLFLGKYRSILSKFPSFHLEYALAKSPSHAGYGRLQ